MSFTAALAVATLVYSCIFMALVVRQKPLTAIAFIVSCIYLAVMVGLSFCRWPA